MSAATREPYLGEMLHVVTVSSRRGKICRPAIVSDQDKDSKEFEVYVIGRPAPYWITNPPHDEVDRTKGSWHFSH